MPVVFTYKCVSGGGPESDPRYVWLEHDDVIKWKHFPRNGPFVREFTGPGEFPTQRPVTRSFDVFFDLRLNKRLSKQSWGWWFETLSWSLWRHYNGLKPKASWQQMLEHDWLAKGNCQPVLMIGPHVTHPRPSNFVIILFHKMYGQLSKTMYDEFNNNKLPLEFQICNLAI